MEIINDEKELSSMIKCDSRFIYFFTPMCGTCKLAHHFLTIVERLEMIPTIYTVDLNYVKSFADKWQIKSVPCLVYVHNGEVINKLYRFESVTNVYQFIENER
ncbi:thioredoxin family protein [Evansella halocellulosilytica]|uniref:thioredoxin family protein n=1 Tax=Evansella halocellulosilytica TaxID=2011013 RepID=UPI000BB73ECC|nr:thioredoxin family protein [Evansella halocellulosilytica]